MIFTSIQRIITKSRISPFQLNYFQANYAKKEGGSVSMLGGSLKKKKGKAGAVMEKRIFPVESDPKRLVSYCCGANIYKTGEDPKLLADSEYPEWLWKLPITPPPPLEQLDPNSKEYWRRIRKEAMRRNNKLAKLKRF